MKLGGGDDRTSKVNLCVSTPSGLFEWLRMPFGLKNAPQIYQRLIDNDFYVYLKIGAGKDATGTDSSRLTNVFTEGEP